MFVFSHRWGPAPIGSRVDSRLAMVRRTGLGWGLEWGSRKCTTCVYADKRFVSVNCFEKNDLIYINKNIVCKVFVPGLKQGYPSSKGDKFRIILAFAGTFQHHMAKQTYLIGIFNDHA